MSRHTLDSARIGDAEDFNSLSSLDSDGHNKGDQLTSFSHTDSGKDRAYDANPFSKTRGSRPCSLYQVQESSRWPYGLLTPRSGTRESV